jgi:WD40 repeat protein
MAIASAATFQTLETILDVAPMSNNRLAMVQTDWRLRIWDLNTREVLSTTSTGDHRALKIVVLGDGRLATIGNDTDIKVWSQTGECQATMAVGARPKAFWVLPDNRLACTTTTADADENIHIFEMDTHTCTGTLEGHSCTIKAMVPLPNGRLVSGGLDEKVILWDLVAGTRIATSSGNVGGIRSMALMSDNLLVCGKGNGDVTVFDTFDMTVFGSGIAPRRTFNAHSDNIDTLLALPDGRIATYCKDETVRIWSVATGDELAVLPGGATAPLLLLPGGTLLTAAGGCEIKAWNLDTYECTSSHVATPIPPEEDDDEPAEEWVTKLVTLSGNRALSVTKKNMVMAWVAGMTG